MILEDLEINIKVKLAGLWTSLVLIYLYADLFGFYIPGHIEEIAAGKIAGIEITQVLLLAFMLLMTLPSLMVPLSLVLKAKYNRIVNIVIGLLQLVLVLGSMFDPNIYFVFASGVESVLLLLIIYLSWKWPIIER